VLPIPLLAPIYSKTRLLVLDGIIVGTFLQNEELGKKASWTRRVVVITDGQNPLEIEEDDIEATVAKLNEWNVELTVMWVPSARLVGFADSVLEVWISTTPSCLSRSQTNPLSRCAAASFASRVPCPDTDEPVVSKRMKNFILNL